MKNFLSGLKTKDVEGPKKIHRRKKNSAGSGTSIEKKWAKATKSWLNQHKGSTVKKITWEQIGEDLMGMNIHYNMFSTHEDIADLIRKQRKYYDNESKLNVFTVDAYDDCRDDFHELVRKYDKGIAIDHPPDFLKI